VSEPESGDGRTETVKRHGDLAVPLACSVAPVGEKGGEEGLVDEEGDKEGIDEGDEGKELEAVVPEPESGALDGEFGLEEAEGGVDLPAATVGENDAPAILFGADGLVGEEMPGRMALGAGHDQPEGYAWELGMRHGKVEQPHPPLLTPAGVPKQTRVE
jgi:hypothetical protein